MKQSIAKIALVVKDDDEAIAFYIEKLNVKLLRDALLDNEKRWVPVAPPSALEWSLLLAKASTDEQHNSIGNQNGGRVFLFYLQIIFKVITIRWLKTISIV